MKVIVLKFLSVLATGMVLLAPAAQAQTNTNGSTNYPNIVSLVPVNMVVSESGSNGVITPGSVLVRRDGPTNLPLTVYLQIEGTAQNGVDYRYLSNQVRIPAGHRQTMVQVFLLLDHVVEETETVRLTIMPPVCIAIWPPPPECYLAGSNHTAIIYIRDSPTIGTNRHPRVAITSPTNGASYVRPADIFILAQASDPDGTVSFVEFYAGTNRIGIRTNLPVTSIMGPFHMVWSNAPAGEHRLTARAVDNLGGSNWSLPVVIHVQGMEQFQPQVNFRLEDAVATEPGVLSSIDAAIVLVTRSGSTNHDLQVYFHIGGTALNGVDYQTISHTVTIPAGRVGVPLRVIALADNLVEGTETVVFELSEPVCAAISPPPPGCYTVGTSRVARVEIRDGRAFEPINFATRDLPPFYVAGRKLTVVIQVRPAHANLVYTIEDTAPPNWVIGAVNQEGIYDPATRKVKFGPFFDGQPRELTYEVTPPAGESGLREFRGTLAVNGILSPIGGDRVISSLSGHPADRNPFDFRMTSAELTAYGHAWQTGEGSNSIPISFVSRAAMIWRRGETYFIDPAHQPPLCWVPSNQVTSTTVGLASIETEGVPIALAAMPTNCQPGVAFNVRIAVEPGVRHSAYAAEDRPAFGWRPSGISHGGVFDPASGKIKWGPFADNQPRSLEYQVVPGLDFHGSAGFAGTVSFDGINHPISGLRHISFGTIPPRETWVLHREHGEVSLRLGGQSGWRYAIEVSTNLLDWTRLNSVICSNETVRVTDPEGAGKPNRFYRAVPEP